MKKLLAAVLFVCAALPCLAKDEKPVVQDEHARVALIAERDYLSAQTQSMPYDLATNQALQAMNKALSVAAADCGDSTKFTLNRITLECEAVPARPVPPASPIPAQTTK